MHGKIILDYFKLRKSVVLFLRFVLNHPFGVTIQDESPFYIVHLISLFRSWAVEESLARSKRVLTTDSSCCIDCSDLKLMYLSKWVCLL